MGKMFQAFNKKTDRWVKGEVVEGKNGGKFFRVRDVKQSNPQQPFKNVPIKRKR